MPDIICSFCGEHENQVDLIVSGQKGHICNHCIQDAANVLAEEKDTPKPLSETTEPPTITAPPVLHKPTELKEQLDHYIIGQEEAKKRLCVAIYSHYKRLRQGKAADGTELEKSNVLLIGPSGTGKTFMLRTLASMLDIPLCIADATSLTQAGYVGNDVETLLTQAYQLAGNDKGKTEQSIIYVDEIDKIARKEENPSITRDVGGEGVQQSLLKLIEGAKVLVPLEGGRKHPEQKMITIDTSNILFIVGGAFEGMRTIIERRMQRHPLGFFHKGKQSQQLADHDLLSHVTPQDFRKYGFIPELVGRLPRIVYFHPLTKASLRKILTDPKNALIKQYTLDFKMDGIDLTFSEDALTYIVEQAQALKLGARALRSVCDTILQEDMFHLPSSSTTQLHVDHTYAANRYEAASKKTAVEVNG